MQVLLCLVILPITAAAAAIPAGAEGTPNAPPLTGPELAELSAQGLIRQSPMKCEFTTVIWTDAEYLRSLGDSQAQIDVSYTKEPTLAKAGYWATNGHDFYLDLRRPPPGIVLPRPPTDTGQYWGNGTSLLRYDDLSWTLDVREARSPLLATNYPQDFLLVVEGEQALLPLLASARVVQEGPLYLARCSIKDTPTEVWLDPTHNFLPVRIHRESKNRDLVIEIKVSFEARGSHSVPIRSEREVRQLRHDQWHVIARQTTTMSNWRLGTADVDLKLRVPYGTEVRVGQANRIVGPTLEDILRAHCYRIQTLLCDAPWHQPEEQLTHRCPACTSRVDKPGSVEIGLASLPSFLQDLKDSHDRISSRYDDEGLCGESSVQILLGLLGKDLPASAAQRLESPEIGMTAEQMMNVVRSQGTQASWHVVESEVLLQTTHPFVVIKGGEKAHFYVCSRFSAEPGEKRFVVYNYPRLPFVVPLANITSVWTGQALLLEHDQGLAPTAPSAWLLGAALAAVLGIGFGVVRRWRVRR